MVAVIQGEKRNEKDNIVFVCRQPPAFLCTGPNMPGEDFSGELKLEGPVTSTRNPWMWKVGQGYKNLEVKQSRDARYSGKGIPVALPAMPVLLGKTTLTTPAGREGLSPRVSYGKGVEGFSCLDIARHGGSDVACNRR